MWLTVSLRPIKRVVYCELTSRAEMLLDLDASPVKSAHAQRSRYALPLGY
jgi:hypothetical protein